MCFPTIAQGKYKNPWHRPSTGFGVERKEYGPEWYETRVAPSEYRGYLIYERISGTVWDVVKDSACITQMAGPNGARRAIDAILDKK